jgi:hypothetical protein
MAEPEQRIMRIPLPVPLIREMDAVIIKGLGGYTTRGEFIVDAIQERVLELTIGGSEDAGPPPVPAASPVSAVAEVALATSTLTRTSPTVPMSALVVPTQGFTVDQADDLARPEGLPLFGLHNRDYPSLWALTKLAGLTAERPIPVETYYVAVIQEAWKFGELLLAIEKHTGTKRTAVFPTNPEKRKAAEMGFRAFAIGDYRGGPNDTYTASGPLFEWRVAALVAGERKHPLIGVTAAGWGLLRAIAGISVEEPHPIPAAAHFLRHLLDHAPADHSGFIEIVRAIGPDGSTRQEVLDHVSKAWLDWTENEVSTNAAGYIARAREWGLVEPKQIKAKYHLTPLAIEHVNGAKA